MLFRFALYGFLKNQRYFEPFLMLALLHRGLDFSQVGLLIGLREATRGLLEIPSGAWADAFGRRRVMATAFAAYALAYGLLGLGSGLLSTATGMMLIGVGDVFRTGTHKAMIFDWLAQQGRGDDRVRIYGYTRSWSQIGSAVSTPIAAAAVFFTGDYRAIFWLAVGPALVNFVNLATYPAVLDGTGRQGSARERLASLWKACRTAAADRRLAGLLLEAASFGGVYKVVRDYLQPVAAAWAAGLLVGASSAGEERTSAWVVGGVYAALHVVSALASRYAHRFEAWAGDADRAATWIWLGLTAIYLGLAFALAEPLRPLAIAGFVAVAVVHNVFRPLLVSRIDRLGHREAAATILSVESQATATSAVLLAPVLGVAVDAVSNGASEAMVWPVAAAGAVFGLIGLVAAVRGGRSRDRSPSEPAA